MHIVKVHLPGVVIKNKFCDWCHKPLVNGNFYFCNKECTRAFHKQRSWDKQAMYEYRKQEKNYKQEQDNNKAALWFEAFSKEPMPDK